MKKKQPIEKQPNDATVRDWYAGQALAGIMANTKLCTTGDSPAVYARTAFDCAEAMMKERKLRQIPK